MKLLGDFWTLMIIETLRDEEKRFCQIERDLPASNPVTLTSRLKKLEMLELVVRRTETVDKVSVSYGLTPKGRAILPIIDQIKLFAENHL
jgi:DNA-binding HxlR family transcriptional regulator